MPCAQVTSATIEEGVKVTGEKALAISGIRSLTRACLTGGIKSYVCDPSSRELESVFSGFHNGEVEMTSMKFSKQEMCSNGTDQPERMANIH